MMTGYVGGVSMGSSQKYVIFHVIVDESLRVAANDDSFIAPEETL